MNHKRIRDYSYISDSDSDDNNNDIQEGPISTLVHDVAVRICMSLSLIDALRFIRTLKSDIRTVTMIEFTKAFVNKHFPPIRHVDLTAWRHIKKAFGLPEDARGIHLLERMGKYSSRQNSPFALFRNRILSQRKTSFEFIYARLADYFMVATYIGPIAFDLEHPPYVPFDSLSMELYFFTDRIRVFEETLISSTFGRSVQDMSCIELFISIGRLPYDTSGLETIILPMGSSLASNEIIPTPSTYESALIDFNGTYVIRQETRLDSVKIRSNGHIVHLSMMEYPESTRPLKIVHVKNGSLELQWMLPTNLGVHGLATTLELVDTVRKVHGTEPSEVPQWIMDWDL